MIHRRSLLRTAVTALVICIVLAAIYALWMRYQVEPLTRDGKVRADLVPVAADVSDSGLNLDKNGRIPGDGTATPTGMPKPARGGYVRALKWSLGKDHTLG